MAKRAWLARALILPVFFFNLLCALQFLFAPAAYAPAFELSGPAGEGMIAGLGVLFLMWNVPYAVALWHPLRRRVSLYEALAMQAIGVAGETFLLLRFPPGHPVLTDSVTRFIVFDATGLGLLSIAALVAARLKR
jgi:hypothetical protein